MCATYLQSLIAHVKIGGWSWRSSGFGHWWLGFSILFLSHESLSFTLPVIDASLTHQEINRYCRYVIEQDKLIEVSAWSSFTWQAALPENYVFNCRLPHWFLFSLYNSLPDTLSRLIYNDFFSLTYNYYALIDSTPVSLSPVIPSNATLPAQLNLSIPPGDTLKIIARMNYQWTGQFFPRLKNFKFYLSDSETAYSRLSSLSYANSNARTANLIFLAIILFLMLFTALQYLVVREQVYILYAFYLASLSIYYFLKKSLLINFEPGIPVFQAGYVPSSILLIYSYVLFIERFLNIKQRLPDVYRLFRIVLIALGVFLIIYFFALSTGWGPYARVGYLYIRSLLVPVGLFVVYRIFKLNDLLSRFIIAGTGFILAFGFLSLTNEINNLIRPVQTDEKVIREFFYLSFTQYGILAEILCFSLGLGYRTKLLQKNNLDLQLKLLRSQLKPHFIFNALNAIKSLISLKKNDQAENYLVQFSGLLREVLIYSEKEVIALYDELEFTKKYLSIENLRFNQELKINFEVDPAVDLVAVKLPPLTLQPIVENALWHGLKNKDGDKKLMIRVQREFSRIRIVVEDNGIGRKNAKKQSAEDNYPNFGLKITQQRLQGGDLSARLYTIDLEDALGQATGTRVVLDIPYSD